MVKPLLAVTLCLAVFSQGIVHAEEPPSVEVTNVDRAVLAERLDAAVIGEKIAVATDEGVVAGELVDRDENDIFIDSPLVQGGAERVAVPLKRIQAVGVQPWPQSPPSRKKTFIILAVAGAALVVLTILAKGLAGP